MSSSASGIAVAPELRSAYESARKGTQTSFLKVQIVGEQLCAVHTASKGSIAGGWSRELDAVARVLDADVPCFIILFKARDDILLMQWLPESATVKDKMSYAASKGALNTLLNAKAPGSPTWSANGSKVEHYFGSTLQDFTYKAYTAHRSQVGPLSEVEEALQALPKSIDRKEFGKSMGYSLLANVSGKALPPQLANYAAGGGNAPHASSSMYGGGGGAHNFYAKPSAARAANAAAGGGFNPNRPPAGTPMLPGWGGGSPTAAKSATSPTHASSSPSATSLSSPSSAKSGARSPSAGPSAAAAAYAAAVAAANAPAPSSDARTRFAGAKSPSAAADATVSPAPIAAGANM